MVNFEREGREWRRNYGAGQTREIRPEDIEARYVLQITYVNTVEGRNDPEYRLVREDVTQTIGSDYIYFDEKYENSAYKWMLIWQERFNKEIVSYLVKRDDGSRGVLVLPWSRNTDDGSFADIKNAKRGALYDHHGNEYKPLALVHTHPIYGGDDNPLDAVQPSGEDIKTAVYINLPSYIINNTFYLRINTQFTPGQHKPAGLTEYLITNYSPISLFD